LQFSEAHPILNKRSAVKGNESREICKIYFVIASRHV
jgi:hypothetical protein